MTALATHVDEVLPVPAASGVSFAGVLRSERIKLTSLRSTVWTVLSAVAGSVGFAGLIVLGILVAPAEGGDAGEIVAATFGERPALGAIGFVVLIAQLLVAVLGVLVVSAERSSGLLAATVAAVPRRTPILAAKLVVSGVASFAVGLVIGVATWLVVQPSLPTIGKPAWEVDAGTLQVVLGTALYLAMISVLSTALGSLFRSSAAGLGLVLGVLLLLPGVLPMIPLVGGGLAQILPSAAGMLLFQPFDQVGWGAILAGLAILLAWVGAAAAGAAVLWKKRDI
ncbi:ABC transporter permease subunit [Naasia aerilata]|uniref:ABC transporter permease n=1 Tax=Naasia aerilata TaxID=1162966 RepID=A0ABM8GD89_9MICO|nr:ABC transporter permease subunit [Naasia aerilata]BDZ46233.1 ABC transporter permease [Naasia aerilata]